MSKPEPSTELSIGGTLIPSGKRTELELQVTRLPTGTWVSLPVAVLRGPTEGPCVFVSAAIHGDELNGVEIARRLLPRIRLRNLRGTLIAAPIVNVLGFLHQDRYLPDRRDLNRCFPGSRRGSLAARMAHMFMHEIVRHCDYGIDLHTGSNHRCNLPQLRVNLDDPRTRRLAEAFQPPLAIHANERDGSLRQVAANRGCPVLVYEAGETLRFDRRSIRIGVRGTLRVLAALDMIDDAPAQAESSMLVSRESQWTRASRGGILLVEVSPGDRVVEGDVVARITETFSAKEREVTAPIGGVVAGVTTNPIVNRGDALVHIAAIPTTMTEKSRRAEA